MTKQTNKTPSIDYTWIDDECLGDVTLHCICGTKSKLGMVDTTDIIECPKCHRKYKIHIKMVLEEKMTLPLSLSHFLRS